MLAMWKGKKWSSGRMYIGRLLNDIFQQSRYMLNNVNVKIKLTRAEPEFALMNHTGTAKARFEINSAKLSIRRVRVSPAVMIAHQKVLAKSNAIYPFSQKHVQAYTLLKGSKTFVKENLYNGKTPKLLIVGMLNSSNFNGMFTANPYNFVHKNVTLVSLKRDGENVPFQAYTPNFAATGGDWLREYLSIYLCCNMIGREEKLSFTYDDYAKGYTFFVFNLTPDLSMTDPVTYASNLRLEMGFKENLDVDVTLLTFAVFDGVLEVDQYRHAYVTDV